MNDEPEDEDDGNINDDMNQQHGQMNRRGVSTTTTTSLV
jgi:hypothetical protein